MISRRHLLATTSALVLLTGASCAFSPTQIQADVEAIASGLSTLVTALAPFAPADVLAKAQTFINTIQANAALIASAVTPSNSILQTISGAISALSALVAPFFPMAPAIAAALQAAVVLINLVLQATGNATPPAHKALMALPPMSADQARALLKGYATNGIR